VINGILVIDKNVGISSYDVIRDIKRSSKRVIDAICNGEYGSKFIKTGECNTNVDKLKIGHAGTLDPFASGLLIILLGNATKKFDEFQQMRKRYEVKIEFGYETDTLDKTGTIVKQSDEIFEQEITIEKIKKIINKDLIGDIKQMPPQYSAKKVNGMKAYEYARIGKFVNLKEKNVSVYKFELLGYKYPYAIFEIECSSGTYIRSLVADLGRKLGSYATAIELRRTQTGEFILDK